MKIKNPKIDLLLGTIGNLSAFAREAAGSAAQDPTLPFGSTLTNIPETDELIDEYKDDERGDRAEILFKKAVRKIAAKAAELEALDVLVDAPAPEAP